MSTSLGQIDQFIEEVDNSQDVEALTLALRKQIDLLEFERFTYQLLKSPAGPRPKCFISGYPKEWTDRYEERNYVSIDMVSRHAARVIRPFPWLEIGRLSELSDEQNITFNEAREFKMNSGATVPIHGPGLAKALFSVTSHLPNEDFIKLWSARRHELQLVATYMHERFLQISLFEYPVLNVKMTPREIEVLTWTSRGKTLWEISEILSIGEATVKTHVTNLCQKLNASNKTHATAVALMHGLIVP